MCSTKPSAVRVMDTPLRVEPLPRGSGFEFKSEVFGGAIPQQFRNRCTDRCLIAA